MLAATPYVPDDVVGTLPPSQGIATVEKVAVNAVLAGCQPEAFPLVIAALDASLSRDFNLSGLVTTTSSVCPILIVNGPCRAELHIDMAGGCMGGAGGRGSMTIGRAVALCLRNIGGQRVPDTTKTVFGQPARTGLCIAEWEEESPWPSLAERRGFSKTDDVVTVHGTKGTVPIADINNDDPLDLLRLIAKSLAYPLTNKFLTSTAANGETVLAVNPIWAQRFSAAFPDLADLQQFLLENAWQPLDLWPAANQRILESKGRVDRQGRVRLAERPDQFVIIVCGGKGSLHAIGLPSWGESSLQSRATDRP
jgi:hypothetical protein